MQKIATGPSEQGASMTERIITDSNGRKHITSEPLLHPPLRTWIPLTDKEIAIVEDEYIVDYRIPAGSAWNFARAIEAALKERNT